MRGRIFNGSLKRNEAAFNAKKTAHPSGSLHGGSTLINIDKVPLREVPRGVAQGHIIITTGRDDYWICS